MNRLSQRLRLEALEDRALLSTCTVDSLADIGAGTDWAGDLRYCITKANTEPGADVIDFTVTGTINLLSTLPDISSDVDIQGPAADKMTVRRSSTSNFRIFTVVGAAAQIRGLTIANGRVYVPWGSPSRCQRQLQF